MQQGAVTSIEPIASRHERHAAAHLRTSPTDSLAPADHAQHAELLAIETGAITRHDGVRA